MPHSPYIQGVFFGRPRTLHDEHGSWRSSIARQPADSPVQVERTGITGDKSTQRFHGGSDSALCVHLADHYSFWRERYEVDLHAGSVGENLTVAGLTEQEVAVGDIVRLGTVLAQVSGPRVPCATQARHVRRPDWVALTVRENRTGFYIRVLEPGTLQAGDAWLLQERINQDASISRINHCMYLHFDRAYAEQMREMPGLSEWWQELADKRMRTRKPHWMESAAAATPNPEPASDAATNGSSTSADPSV